MKKRDLKDILREVQKDGVKEPETIRQYICTLGDRTLYSLMYGDKEHCSEEERYECWSYLEFVPMAYACFWDFTDEEIACCMKHITFKDFLCLIDHLNDQNMKPADFEEGSNIINDFGLAHMQEMALGCLLKLILRAKGRGDEDVNNFCLIHVNSMFDAANGNDNQDVSAQGKGPDKEMMSRAYTWTDRRKKELEMLIDCFYVIKDRLDLDNRSWMRLNIGCQDVEFRCLRELTVDCMKDLGPGEEFSLPKVLERCEMICKEMRP